MCLTGAFLILFVTFHVLMNGVAIFWPTAYNMVCEFLGANWYALIGSGVLALGFILHIVYATWLTVQNRKARGHERYEVTSRPPQVEWSSKNMLVLGIVILAFLVLHLVQRPRPLEAVLSAKVRRRQSQARALWTAERRRLPASFTYVFFFFRFTHSSLVVLFLLSLRRKKKKKSTHHTQTHKHIHTHTSSSVRFTWRPSRGPPGRPGGRRRRRW